MNPEIIDNVNNPSHYDWLIEEIENEQEKS